MAYRSKPPGRIPGQPSSRNRYTDECLFEMGREQFDQLGEKLTLRAFCQNTGVSSATIINRYGGWRKFIERLGLGDRIDPQFGLRPVRRPKYSDEYLIELAQTAARSLGSNMSQNEFCLHAQISPSTVGNRFGTWEEFRRRAGLRPRDRRNLKVLRYTRDEIVDQLRDVGRQLGPDVTQAEFARRTGITTGIVQRHFQSWEQLRTYAELPPHGKPLPRYSDEFLLKDLAEVAETLRRIPTLKDYRALGHANPNTLLRRFGPDWRNVQWHCEKWLKYRQSLAHPPVEPCSIASHQCAADG